MTVFRLISLFLIFSVALSDFKAQQVRDEPYVGVSIGTDVSNLLPPTKLVSFLQQQKVAHIRLYDADEREFLASKDILNLVEIEHSGYIFDRQSFLNTAKWIEEVRTERGANVIIVLVGNKNDLVEERHVTIEEGEAKANELGVEFMETSARTGFNIKALFRKTATSLPKNETMSSTKQEDHIEVNVKYSSITSRSDKLINGLQMPMGPPSATYQVLFLGDQTVGKTSILTRFIHEKFDSTYKATEGVRYFSKRMYIQDRIVMLSYRDTTGKEKDQSACCLKDSSVVVIVYDVTNRQSFLNTAKWIEEVHTVGRTDVIIVLAGNKTDLLEERQVSIGEGENKAHELGAMFIETSSKFGFNIKPLLMKTAASLPKTETLSSTKQKYMEDMNLKSSTSQLGKTVSSTKHEDSIAKYKVVYLGDKAVGKTSIIASFMYGEFSTKYEATIGVDFFSKTLCIQEKSVLGLQLWDTAGDKRFWGFQCRICKRFSGSSDCI